MSYRASKEVFNRIIEKALAELPEQFADVTEVLRIEVRDRPTAQMLRDSGVKPGHTLLGLYHGRPATRRSVEDSGVLPDVIYLFQGELERICSSEQELEEQVRKTLLHEIGHYFGLDEDDLADLGYA